MPPLRPVTAMAHLFIDPDAQSAGLGGALLDAALGQATGADARLICATADPRAIRLYAHPRHGRAPDADGQWPRPRRLDARRDAVGAARRCRPRLRR